MTWFRIDDNLALHPKVLAAGNAAMGLWARAGAWSAQQLTDGFVPVGIVDLLGNPRQAKALVDAGLWVAGDGGYRFHQWDERQPCREQVEAERAAARDRMKTLRAGRRSGELQAKFRGSSSPQCSQPPSRPDPSRRDGETSRDPSQNATRARTIGGWHALVIEARRSAGAGVGPSWSKRRCLNEVVQAVLEHEVTEDVAWAALVELARETETQHPGRLTHQLQRVLEQAVRPPLRLVSGRPAWCGSCKSDGLRVVEVDGDIKPCPTCGRRTA